MRRLSCDVWRAAGLGFLILAGAACPASASGTPGFYRDIRPILAAHCQSCHRPGEIAPFPLVTYEDARRWAKRMAKSVAEKKMPPWFADPCCGHFQNDPSLSERQIRTIEEWAEAGAPAGDEASNKEEESNKKAAPPAPHWTKGWNIPPPDLVVKIPVAVKIPRRGDVEYTYEIVPTNFSEAKWVQAVELKPSARAHVHHAVVYIRPPESNWLRGAPLGVPFTASSLHDPHLMHQAHATTSDLLLVYAPGSAPENWPEGVAKFIPAHSDVIFQMHYTTNGHAARDQTALGMVFAKTMPKQRVLTLQLANDHDTIPIPPNTDNYRVEVSGTLPNDCTLLGFFPHMHLRGKKFEYNLVHPDGSRETLLRVNYDFYWQLSYILAQPRFLPAETKLEAIGWYDNSRSNAHNPDPDRPVEWGDQTYNEMMVGFFDVAVPAGMSKQQFFVRSGSR